MLSYEEHVRKELVIWERQMLKNPGFVERKSKQVQAKINDLIPEKAQQALTVAVKSMVQTVLFGIDYIPKGPPIKGLNLEARDRLARELLAKYRKIGAVEGAGTGAGGIILGLADFPALLVIKMKFLFELAHLYGFSTKDYRERLYLLYVFQLAFSSSAKRPELYYTLAQWDKKVNDLARSEDYLKQIDWEQFQREYRDAIDLRKTLQLLPGLGIVAGAWANYSLLDDLGKIGTNCYRMRLLAGMS